MSSGEEDPRVPIVLITDIGRDIDDTIALFVVHAYRARSRLVGIITCGSSEDGRAEVAREYLHMLGYADGEVPVAAGRATKSKAGQVVGPFHTQMAEPASGSVLGSASAAAASAAAAVRDDGAESAEALLLRLAKAHAGRLVVMGIGPLTSIAKALEVPGGEETLRSGLQAIYVQGQVVLDEPAVAPAAGAESSGQPEDSSHVPPGLLKPLTPDTTAAFNLREDADAAKHVFGRLSPYLPFGLLGKHAAYAVSLTASDFVNLPEKHFLRRPTSKARGVSSSSSSSSSSVGGEGDGGSEVGTFNLLRVLRRHMTLFMRGNPELFYRLYHIPQGFRPPAHAAIDGGDGGSAGAGGGGPDTAAGADGSGEGKDEDDIWFNYLMGDAASSAAKAEKGGGAAIAAADAIHDGSAGAAAVAAAGAADRTLSHPYDPLLMLLYFEPGLFEPMYLGGGDLKGDDPQASETEGSSSRAAPLMQRHPPHHILVGNSAGNSGVRDPEKARAKLRSCLHVALGDGGASGDMAADDAAKSPTAKRTRTS